MTPMDLDLDLDLDHGSETDSGSRKGSAESDSRYLAYRDILHSKTNHPDRQWIVCRMIRDNLLFVESNPSDELFRLYHRLMHNESCRYRSTIANLSPSPVTDEEKRWHQFYMRAVVTQQRHPPVNQHNYNTRPVPDYAFDKQWATKVLDQTKAWLNNNPLNDSEDNETHRHDPARQIVNFLTHGHSPSSEEAVYCSTDEAMELVAAGDKILITKDQQQINWGGRPIEALFGTWYTPSDLASETEVNIPQRPISSYIKVKKTIRDVSRRFLENHPSTESWNILDLRNPIPPRSPSFLDTPNSQLFHSLLEEIHNDRRPATHNLLLSEGGNHTAAHVDSHGFGTFITVHEGQFGFGWVAVKNVEDRELWEKDPLSLDVAKMARYVILHPGQTGYFPSGTIHFVFRLVDEPTLAVSGDALAWSCILQWLRVLRRQELDKSAANSDVTQTSVKKWTSSLRKLVTQRINLSKTDDTQDHLQLIGGEEMAQHIIEIIKASIESYKWKSFHPDE